MFINLRRAILIFFLFPSASFAGNSVIEQIESLEPFIGSYPPNFSSEEEFNQIKEKYLELLDDLDKSLLDKPENQETRYLRGWLFTLGHNMNHPVAWQGAKDDFELLIKNDKSNIPARIKLATHLVNSKQEYSPEAEKLFREAQCLAGTEPIEEVQRGIFFAFYYQGEMQNAYTQAQYLRGKWPNSKQYEKLEELVISVLNRTNTEITETKEKPLLISCINET